jgi:X-Pro dipeptidyl-peptidase
MARPLSLLALVLAAALTLGAAPAPGDGAATVADDRPGRSAAGDRPPSHAPAHGRDRRDRGGDGEEPEEPDSEQLPDLDEIDPVRFDRDDAVVEHVQVTTRNGIDQMWVDIVRPDTDEAVPTILIASPYDNTLGRGWRGELKSAHQGPENPGAAVGQALGGGSTFVEFPEWYDEYFVERGYAVALMDLRGTRNSSGCMVYGDRAEVRDTVDVIDWIADQEWSNQKVGMTGGSYDGTIAIGAAAEQPMSGRHPDALAAIIPLRAISRWYDYHFFNGVQSMGHALTPSLFNAVLAGIDTQNSGTDDVLFPLHVAERKACIPTFGAITSAGYASPYQDARDDFWRQRDFVRSAPGIRAATFIVSGLFDFNVKNNNTSHLWEALPDHLPKQLWWMNATHADPHVPTSEDAGSHTIPHPFQEKFVEATHRWYAQFLKDLDAGALATPTVESQRADGTWDADDVWPAPGDDLVLGIGADGRLAEDAHDGEVAFRDGPVGSAAGSELLVTEAFERDTRISGQIAFDLDAVTDGPDATVAVDVRAVPPGVDPSSSAGVLHDGQDTRAVQLTYGWIRAYYRDSVPLRGLSTPTGGEFVTPGEPVQLTFGALATDLVVPQGWRLALEFSSSAGGTVASQLGGDVTLTSEPGRGVRVPVADG